MKVFAVNASSRKDGNTAILINTVLEEIRKEGIETEFLQLAGHELKGCKACYLCFKNKNRRCAQDTDMLNEILEKMSSADGIILGSPTYFCDVSTNMKALIERCGLVARANNFMLKRKVGAAVVAVRRAGSIQALNSINIFFQYMQMIIPGSSYWNMAIGGNIGDVLKDEEGMRTMRDLGANVAWLLKKLSK